MIDMVQEFLQNELNYELTEYKVIEADVKKAKINKILLIVFGVIFLLYLITAILGNPLIPLWVVFLALLFFVIAPYLLRKNPKFDFIVITPEYLVQRADKKRFVAMNYDEIVKFELKNDGIYLRDTSHQIILDHDLYRGELEGLIDILEAKGKTFDRTKEYMVRPVIVHIKNNQVVLEDIEQISTTEILMGRYTDKYEMLTPGFIEDIIFMNTMITGGQEDGENCCIRMSSLEVKEGHPENTKFESIFVEDCILIIENLKISRLVVTDQNDRSAEDMPLERTTASFVDNIQNGIITHWKFSKNKATLYILVGVSLVKVNFSYKELIVGWNIVKK